MLLSVSTNCHPGCGRSPQSNQKPASSVRISVTCRGSRPSLRIVIRSSASVSANTSPNAITSGSNTVIGNHSPTPVRSYLISPLSGSFETITTCASNKPSSSGLNVTVMSSLSSRPSVMSPSTSTEYPSPSIEMDSITRSDMPRFIMENIQLSVSRVA